MMVVMAMMIEWRFKRRHMLHRNTGRLSLLLHCRMGLSISNIVVVGSLYLPVPSRSYKARDDY